MSNNGVVNQYLALEESPEVNDLWRPVVIEGVREGYEVSRDGLVASPQGKILKTNNAAGLQHWITMRAEDGSAKSARVDKMVLTAFVGEAPEGMIPIHLDDDPTNCRVDNLTWGPPQLSTSPDAVRHRQLRQKRPRVRRSSRAQEVSRPVGRPRKPKSAGVEVLRLYRDGKLQITVDQNGSAKLPKLTYSAEELARLAQLVSRAVEMNDLMKL